MSVNFSELNEEKRIEHKADQYFKKYKTRIECLESSSIINKLRSVTPYDVYALGKQLETFETYKAICEEDGTLAQLGKLPNIALDVITASYGTSPLSVIASVQPIEEEQGIVYFRNVIAQTTRGNVTAGQKIHNATAMEDVAPYGFASNRIVAVLGTGNGTLTTFTTNLIPNLRPGSVQITVANDPTTAFMDNGNGLILGNKGAGQINYATGVIEVRFNAAPATGAALTVTYAIDTSAQTDLPKIISKLETKPVSARVFALKDTIGLDSSYALRKRFGVIAEDQAAEDLVAAINAETMNTAVIELAAKAQGNTSWSKAAPAGVSYFEHKQTLKDSLATAEGVLLGNAGRGQINVLIAGRNACSILQTLPGFVKLSDGSTVGPHIFGTLDGTIVVRVPNSSVLGTDEILALYKGTSPFDSALVYAPYMPLLVTTALPNGLNPLLNQKAAAVWAAIENLVPNFVTRITITA